MEGSFNPNTHREDYGKVETELSVTKKEISGEKNDEELQALITKRDELKKSLEEQKNNAHEAGLEDNKVMDSAIKSREETEKEMADLQEHIKALNLEIEKIKGGKIDEDLTDLQKVDFFVLSDQRINPKNIFIERDPTDTQAGFQIGFNFYGWVVSRLQDIDTTVESTKVTSFTLDERMTGDRLRKKTGETKLFTIDQIAVLINNQCEMVSNLPKATSPLDTSGESNIFFVEVGEGSVKCLDVVWKSDKSKWCVSMYDESDRLHAGCRFFCRND